jgi:hypothetical protein
MTVWLERVAIVLFAILVVWILVRVAHHVCLVTHAATPEQCEFPGERR